MATRYAVAVILTLEAETEDEARERVIDLVDLPRERDVTTDYASEAIPVPQEWRESDTRWSTQVHWGRK